MSSSNFSGLAKALFAIALNDFERAVQFLRIAAFEEMEPYVMWFLMFPPLRHLNDHPSFGQFRAALVNRFYRRYRQSASEEQPSISQ